MKLMKNLDVEHDIRQQKFYTMVKGKEYSFEYNAIEANLWEFHCLFMESENTYEAEIQEKLLEYVLYYMSRNKIRIYDSGACFFVKEFLEKRKDLNFLIS